MKNIQIIDPADNCTYPLFAATDHEFEIIFQKDADIEFIEDFIDRVGEDFAAKIMDNIWRRPVAKKTIHGIHGTLYYQLLSRKIYYPTKRESEMTPLGND